MMILFLQIMVSTALAVDVPPRERTTPTSVRGRDGEHAYHTLTPNQSLSFTTPGPGKWGLEARQRVAGAAQRAAGSIEVLGNGTHKIMTIKLKANADRRASIDDTLGGSPTTAERAWITVPSGGEFITLRSPPGSRDILVRLYTNEPAPAPSFAAAPAAALPADDLDEDPPEDGVISSNVRTNDTLDDAPPEKPQRRNTKKSDVEFGGSMGLGIPARGTKAVGYIGLEARYPVYGELISIGGSTGWYRIGVKDDLEVADPYMGHTTIQADWRTDVFPLITRGLFHVPYKLGPAEPLAGIGLAMFIAKRVDGTQKTTRFGVGPEILAGTDFDLKHLGRLGTHLTWTEARMRLGNTGPDGAEVKETIAHTRLNLTWMTRF